MTTSKLETQVDAERSVVTSDGAYGRFQGALDWGLAAGARYGGASDAFAGVIATSIHFFTLAGVYGAWQESFEPEPEELRRSFSVGASLKPLFLLRWSKDLEHGPAVADLALDSFALGLGARIANIDGSYTTGVETSLGAGIPLFAKAGGPWLELGAALVFLERREPIAEVVATLAWHQWFEGRWLFD
ncbi:MAG TPA: hypothetical protein VF989_01180 [Polyangiaceae bacterium]